MLRCGMVIIISLPDSLPSKLLYDRYEFRYASDAIVTGIGKARTPNKMLQNSATVVTMVW